MVEAAGGIVTSFRRESNAKPDSFDNQAYFRAGDSSSRKQKNSEPELNHRSFLSIAQSK